MHDRRLIVNFRDGTDREHIQLIARAISCYMQVASVETVPRPESHSACTSEPDWRGYVEALLRAGDALSQAVLNAQGSTDTASEAARAARPSTAQQLRIAKEWLDAAHDPRRMLAGWTSPTNPTPREVHRAGTETEADRAMLAQGEIPAHIANPVAPAHFCLAKGCTRKVRGLKSWCWQHADMQGHREGGSR